MPSETRMISTEEEGWLALALGVLSRGGLVAFPTDTVYGLGALASINEAVEAIYRAKARPPEKSIPVLVAGWAEASSVAVPVPPAERLARAFWPGPVTIVLRRTSRLDGALWPSGSVGVRAPNHPVALALLRSAGALATSSANRSGEPSVRTAGEVRRSLEGRVDLIVDGGRTPGGQASTVVDCTGVAPVVLREGPVSIEQIRAAWGGRDSSDAKADFTAG
jgi:tRNA threonylcarbamoyl adenosine modification protein (Sua5/YciO/YrdC/YwlC family)